MRRGPNRATIRAETKEAVVTSALHPVDVQAPGQRSPHGLRGGGWRRAGLTLFFGSVAVNAALGIYALLLAGEVGETEGKILGSSLSVTGALLLALACLPAWERQLLGVVPPAGATASLGGFALVIAAVWTEAEDDLLAKVMGSLLVFAVAAALASVVVLARLPERYGPVFAAELVLIAVAAGMLELQLWLELEGGWYARAFGVVGIALAALTVSIPVLYRLGRAGLAAELASQAQGAIRFCPYCGEALGAEEATTAACAACGRRFSVLGNDVRP